LWVQTGTTIDRGVRNSGGSQGGGDPDEKNMVRLRCCHLDDCPRPRDFWRKILVHGRQCAAWDMLGRLVVILIGEVPCGVVVMLC